MSKGPLLAEGRTAEIYAWGADQVVKLYREGWPRDDAENEARKTRAAQKIGFAVPAVGDVVDIDGRAGIIYERIQGSTIGEQLMAKLWRLNFFAGMLAELHAEMH